MESTFTWLRRNSRISLGFWLLCAAVSVARAQTHDAIRLDSAVVPSESLLPKLIIKYSLTALLEPTPTIQLAVEHRLGNTMSLQHEIGYITSYPVLYVQQYSGVRLHSELRKYLKPFRINKKNDYVAIELSGKYNESSDNFWYCRDNCNYLEQIDRTRRRISVSLSFEYGLMYVFDDRLVIDVVAGIGVRHSNMLFNNLPEGVTDRDQSAEYSNLFSNLLSDMTVEQYGLAPIFGVKMGYAIR